MKLSRWYTGLIWRPLLQQRGRSLATIAAVALGVAVPIAIFQANQGAVGGFASAVEMMAGDAGWEISAPGGMDESLLPTVSWLREYGMASPVVQGHALLDEGSASAPGKRLLLLGIDPLRDAPVRGYRWLEFSDGRKDPTPGELLSLISQPDSAIVPQALARRLNRNPGDKIALIIGDERKELIIRALLHDEGPAKAMGGDLILLDIGSAQTLLSRQGRIDRIDLKPWPGQDSNPAFSEAIQNRLPSGWVLQQPFQRGATGKNMLASFQFNLTMLGGMALLVGLFLVHQAISVSVITRRSEIGLLRTMGMARRGIAGLFLGQTLAFVIPGTLIGVPLGQFLASRIIGLTATTVETLYVATSSQVPPLDNSVWFWAFAITLPLGLLSAAGPVREAFHLPPLSLVHPGFVGKTRRGHLSHLWFPVLLIAAWACTFVPVWQGKAIGGYLATAFLVAAATVAVPLVFRILLAFGKRIRPRSGVVWRLALASLHQGLPRLSLSTAALATALALTTAIAIMVASFRVTVGGWVEQNLGADLYLRSLSQTRGGEEVALSADVPETIAAHPAVEAIDRLRTFDVPFRASSITVGGADFSVSSRLGKLRFKEPDTDQQFLAGLIGKKAITISESLALRQNFAIGDLFPLPTPEGERPMPIVGIYRDYSNDRGSVMMDRAVLSELYGEQPPTNLAVYLKKGSDAAVVRDEMLAALGAGRPVLLFTQNDIRTEVIRIFDSTFAITWALETIAALMAMGGIATCLYTLFLEQRREWDLLRLLGTSSRQLRGIAMSQAAAMGFVSQLLGLCLGLAMAAVLVFVINVQSFGWTIEFRPPWFFLAASLVVVPLFTCWAGLLALRQVMRQNNGVITVSE